MEIFKNNNKKGKNVGKNGGKNKSPIPGMFGGAPTGGQFFSNLLTAVLIFLIISTLYSAVAENKAKVEEVPVSKIAQDISGGVVKKIVVEGGMINAEYTDGTKKKSKKENESSLSQTLVNYGVSAENLAKVEVEVKNESGFGYYLINILPFLLPILLIVFVFWMLSKQVKGAGMQAFSFGQSKARIIDPNDQSQKVTFKDVAGAKEAKEELVEIVDFLRNPKKFLDIGARIPKGVLLMGAPGTGKTLLARAVAGEAAVPFFHLSGSEFVEMFVGVGASRVRDLFKMAKKAAPSIIFVDEIDAVGRVRGGGVGGGNDEREQTLNQILVEMDGFEPSEKVIVMAATNRPDVLDPALLRPGRFDRRVTLELPDREGREEILNIHARKKPLAEDVNLKVIAERTPGFSGADLSSLMNEGAILAAREDRKTVAQYDLIRSIEKVMLGPERKSHILSKEEKKITAYHEAGHALVASVLPNADPVHKISIIARGNAGGYTLKLPLEETRLRSRKDFLDDIAMSLGGYVAEEMVFGDITTGPSNDLQVATALARDMVTKYGMSEKLGPVALEGSGGRALFGGRGVDSRDYSEEVSAKIDAEVSKIMNDAFARAREACTEHRKALDAIANELVVKESIERDDFEKLLVANGIMPKKLNKEMIA
ncbi:MAG: Lysyl-tRNA synthetase [Parcubacteria group bacterium GW2011_GWA1_44_13]|uniref:ATP-dependent zinc metalloprotease FtsH n=1 Tax=Candidatus Nomurabacteria bacterium GW2011_GWB1_44_12 TaxID=1618748 RepID=A0A837IAX9_9BACT|nr:MAG: Lysyl-tRNA synthetase [Candidatus Nomurabacteria bacterium GW2011_GWD1_44_10]KKT36826.1 MAG: Lysyl-tRNA synthetase [Candidatus Nomurabacteria bacterium GW2011_GWB1_44_12]KKT37399.1 MAG: Lysyl-tRNA synthetase [Parcubacteria group bacterium GW2011_GWA1_44_13]